MINKTGAAAEHKYYAHNNPEILSHKNRVFASSSKTTDSRPVRAGMIFIVRRAG